MEKGEFFPVKLKLEWESFKKENLKKDLMNLTEANHQIFTLFQTITDLKAIWMLRVSTLF